MRISVDESGWMTSARGRSLIYGKAIEMSGVETVDMLKGGQMMGSVGVQNRCL